MSGMNSTNRTQRALAQPDRSWLRKMSMKIQIRIQIQMTHRKKMKIDQNTFSSGYDESASGGIAPPLRPGRPRQRPAGGSRPRAGPIIHPPADQRHHPSQGEA